MAMRTVATDFSITFAMAALFASTSCLAAAQPGFVSPDAVVPDVQHIAWDLRMPKDAPVVLNGEVSFDTAGTGAGGMLYVGGLAGLAVGIAVHGAIESAAKKEQKLKLQEAANQVLAPYKEVLVGYRNRALVQDAIAKASFGNGKKLLDETQNPGTDWVIESVPTFLVTQDQHAFIIDNAITIYSPTAPKIPVYQNVVHAVSRSRPADAAEFWTANQGEQLKGEFADLYTMSIDVALQALADGPKEADSPYKTVRYMEGANEKIERGQVLHEQCNRVVLKTLRGALMSLPTQPAEMGGTAPASCADPNAAVVVTHS